MRTTKHTGTKSTSRAKLAVEGLESRTCLSTTAVLTDGTLRIIGDELANDVGIIINDNANALIVNTDGVEQTFVSSDVRKLNISLKDGDDHVAIYAISEDAITHMWYNKDMLVKLGAGNDEAELRLGGLGWNAKLHANVTAKVCGGVGEDEFTLNMGQQVSGKLWVDAFMGADNDKAFAHIFGDIGGPPPMFTQAFTQAAPRLRAGLLDSFFNNSTADVRFNLQGGAGNDTLSSWDTYDAFGGGYSKVDVLEGSLLSISLLGQDGNDSLFMHYNGQVDGQLLIGLQGGAGNDIVGAPDGSGDITLQPGSTGDLFSFFNGDSGADKLNYELYDLSDGLADIVLARLDGGSGFFDKGVATDNVTIVNCEPDLFGGIFDGAVIGSRS